jgi:hypothetical protein
MDKRPIGCHEAPLAATNSLPCFIRNMAAPDNASGLAEEFGGDTVGRLGMCAHTPKQNKNNAHGVTPIHNERNAGG